MEETTIVVVDDHPLFHKGMVNMLDMEPGYIIFRQASNDAESCYDSRLHPKIAEVDIYLPGMNGQQVTH